eukprot:11881684-Alexandrium_andersonii.AAC.1
MRRPSVRSPLPLPQPRGGSLSATGRRQLPAQASGALPSCRRGRKPGGGGGSSTSACVCPQPSAQRWLSRRRGR